MAYAGAMDDKSDTDTRHPNDIESRPARLRWQLAHPVDRPPQELVDAVLAQDEQRLARIHDPNLRLLMLQLAEAARQSDGQANAALQCFLAQADALMNFVHNSIPLARELDLLKQYRAGLIALQDYSAGSDAKLRTLRGKVSNTTKPRRPSAARERALIRLFVHVLTGGGMDEVQAEKLVAEGVSDNGLKRTRLGVHGVCVAIDLGDAGDRTGAEQFKVLKKAALPADVHQWDDEQRLAWVKQRATVFRKL